MESTELKDDGHRQRIFCKGILQINFYTIGLVGWLDTPKSNVCKSDFTDMRFDTFVNCTQKCYP